MRLLFAHRRKQRTNLCGKGFSYVIPCVVPGLGRWSRYLFFFKKMGCGVPVPRRKILRSRRPTTHGSLQTSPDRACDVYDTSPPRLSQQESANDVLVRASAVRIAPTAVVHQSNLTEYSVFSKLLCFHTRRSLMARAYSPYVPTYPFRT